MNAENNRPLPADNNKIILQASLGLSGGVLTTLLINYLIKNRNKAASNSLAQETLESLVTLPDVESNGKSSKEAIQELIKVNKSKYKNFGRLRVPEGSMKNNKLYDEISFLDSPLCEIERVPNLILDLGLESFQELLTPIASHTHDDTFINTNSYILSYAAFGPNSLLQNAKRWLRAGPRYHNYFSPEKTKALIITQDGLCPGLNVVIREITMTLNYNIKVEEIYGARFGWGGVVNEDFEKLIPGEIKTIHHRGGTYLGTSRTGFDKEKVLDSIIRNGFNQIYVICGTKSMENVLELYYEIRHRKLNIAICNIPRSVDNDIPIIDESFGYQSCIEEAQRIIESAWVESRSHKNGVGLIRIMGQKTGFIAMGSSLASGCVNVCLIPEFNYDLYGKDGVLEYVNQRAQKKGNCIVVLAEGTKTSFADVDQEIQDVGLFFQDELNKYCKQKGDNINVKYFDPLYMLRAVKANAYDTKICSTVSQNAVHALMAGFTGFSIGHVHNKTCLIPLEEILSGNYKNKITSGNKNWQRLLASNGQPSFMKEEDIKKIAV